MTKGSFVLPWMTALFFSTSLGHGHTRAIDTYYVSTGYFFELKCDIVESPSNVSWSRKGNGALPSGVDVHEGALWFLPVESSHNGTYVCSSDFGRWEFEVLVSGGPCPAPVENRSITKGTRSTIPCKQAHILRLDRMAHFQWLKDCGPVEQHTDRQGHKRFLAATDTDAGVYTCLVNFTLNGKNYTTARSIRLNIDHDPGLSPPTMVYPVQEIKVVELGTRVEISCLANFGLNDDENFMDWIVNDSFSDNYEELTNSEMEYVPQGNQEVFGQCTLFISEVLPEFLDVPIRCRARNPTGQNEGLVWLQRVDHSAFYTCLALSLAFSLVLLAVITAVVFKVDLVLIYRKLCPRLAKQRVQDGKLYDAYVSYLHSNELSSPEEDTFALKVLPEVLETQHGYRLYVRGRDDSPGEAVHDVISEMVRQSRRLIIVLSASTESSTDPKMEEALSLQHTRGQLDYEQRIGLYDALTKSGLRVILVETGGPVDYGDLPESLRYVKKKQGALRWRDPSGDRGLSRGLQNGHFWKCLRAAGGLVDAGAAYEKALAEETTKLQRLYGTGDLESFPEFKFTEPKLDEVTSK